MSIWRKALKQIKSLQTKNTEKKRGKKGKREGGLWHVQDEIFLRVY